MEGKATIQLNAEELTLLLHVSIKRSKTEFINGNDQKSQQLLLLADKLADAKDELYQSQYELKK